MMMMMIMVIIMIMIIIMMMMMMIIIMMMILMMMLMMMMMMMMIMMMMMMMMMMISMMTLTGAVRDVVLLTVGSICLKSSWLSHEQITHSTSKVKRGNSDILYLKPIAFFNWLKPLTRIRGKETGNHKRQAEENTTDRMQTIQAVTLTALHNAGKVHRESTTGTSRIQNTVINNGNK